MTKANDYSESILRLLMFHSNAIKSNFNHKIEDEENEDYLELSVEVIIFYINKK